MRNHRPCAFLGALLAASALAMALAAPRAAAQTEPATAQGEPAQVIETRTHRFTQIAEDVYQITGTGAVNVGSNSMLVVGSEDLLLVDSHITPHAARALLAAVGEISDRPVRYLINTHYHFDHAHGNQAFPPAVEIIGHTHTRERLSGEHGNVLEETTFLSFTEGVPAQVEDLRRQVAEETDPARRAELEARLAVQQAHMASLAETEPTPPNLTLEREMRIYQATSGEDREIRLLHLGRGHTGGDVVVLLPRERVVFTGDLMLPFLSYMGDAYVQDWPDTLEALKALDFDVLLPGHGAPLREFARIDHFQAYLRDLWQTTAERKAQGLSAEQAAERIDMSAHREHYPQIDGPGVDIRAIRRIYALLDADPFRDDRSHDDHSH